MKSLTFLSRAQNVEGENRLTWQGSLPEFTFCEDINMEGVLQMSRSYFFDPRRRSSRKKYHLSSCTSLSSRPEDGFQNLLHVVSKSKLEHLIRLIKDDMPDRGKTVNTTETSIADAEPRGHLSTAIRDKHVASPD